MKINFFVHSSHGKVLEDLDWCETHPVGGSETAALRMAAALRELGHEANIITEIERGLNEECDVFVSLRQWKVFDGNNEGNERKKCPGRLNYLCCQDDVDQPFLSSLHEPEIAREIYEKCDGFIFLSHYQQRRWVKQLSVPAEKVFLSSNGIPLSRFSLRSSNLRNRPPRAYYSSTPYRGLEQLLEFWPMIKGAVPEAELVICSSLCVYQLEEKEEFERLYQLAKKMEGVIYKGSLGQRELRVIAEQSRVLAYPCLFPETSCIAAMEAMAAGSVVVSTALGALPETAWRNPLVPLVPGWEENWAFEVARILVDDDYYENIAQQNLKMASLMSWNSVAEKWLLKIRSDFAARGEKIDQKDKSLKAVA